MHLKRCNLFLNTCPVFLKDILMASLTISELRKRDNFFRVLEKIKNSVPLSLTPAKQKELGIETVVIQPDEKLLLGLSQMTIDPFRNPSEVLPDFISGTILLLPTEDGKSISSGSLQKTNEFGGLAPEVVFEREEEEHKRLQFSLMELTQNGTKPIRLIIKTASEKIYTYENIVSVKLSERKNGVNGKSDFELLDYKGRTLVKLSHKFGRTARHFRQWSGIKEFEDHEEIKDFGKAVKTYLEENQFQGEVFPTSLCLGRKLKDERLKKLAIYGTDEQRVDFLVQGACSFRTVNNIGVVLSANLILSREETLEMLPEAYEPILLVRRGDLHRTSFGIKGCRAVIYPEKGRKVHKFI